MMNLVKFTRALKVALPVTALLLGSGLTASLAHADNIPVGYISYDAIFPGNSAEFDITNLTGPNSSGDATFPISTSVNLSSLSLTVNFSDGSSIVEPSTYFTLGLDGLSFNGTPFGIGGASPLATSATLTGDFNPTTITLFDGTVDTIDAAFTATVLPSAPPDLQDGDFAIIYATTSGGVVTTPEASSGVLLLTGILGLLGLFAVNRRRQIWQSINSMPGVATAALPVVAVMAFAFLAPGAQASTVKLSTATTPSSGTTGTNVNVTATTGWPAADSNASHVTVTWASTCGGTSLSTGPANSLKALLPGSDR